MAWRMSSSVTAVGTIIGQAKRSPLGMRRTISSPRLPPSRRAMLLVDAVLYFPIETPLINISPTS